MPALLDAEERNELIERVEQVSDRTVPVERRDEPAPAVDAGLGRAWYYELESCVEQLAVELPAGIEDYEAKQLLLFLISLRKSAAGDVNGTKSRADAELALAKMRDVLRRMKEKLESTELRDPKRAIELLLAEMTGVNSADLAGILGVSPKTLSVWSNSDDPNVSPDNLRRLSLVAGLVARLRLSRNPAGIAFWFSKENHELAGRSAIDLMDKDLDQAEVLLPQIARAGRARLG